MNCEKCGRAIKRGYKLNGMTLGIECYKSENVYYNDPALAVYNAAERVLSGDKSLLSTLPKVWSVMPSHIKDAGAHVGLGGIVDGNHACWLAVITHNVVAKKMFAMGHSIHSVGEYKRFE